MKTSRIGIFCLVAGILGAGQLALLTAADADCVQVSYDVRLVPYSIDPAAVRGSLLPPVPGDSATWEVPSGKWNRPRAICCDPEGTPVTVVYDGGTLPSSAVSIEVNNIDHTWRVSAELPPGDHLLYFVATDHPQYGESETRVVTIAFRVPVPPNQSPVLN